VSHSIDTIPAQTFYLPVSSLGIITADVVMH